MMTKLAIVAVWAAALAASVDPPLALVVSQGDITHAPAAPPGIAPAFEGVPLLTVDKESGYARVVTPTTIEQWRETYTRDVTRLREQIAMLQPGAIMTAIRAGQFSFSDGIEDGGEDGIPAQAMRDLSAEIERRVAEGRDLPRGIGATDAPDDPAGGITDAELEALTDPNRTPTEPAPPQS